MLISQSRDEISLSIFFQKNVFVSDRFVVTTIRGKNQSKDCWFLTAVDRHVVRSKKMNFDLKIAD